MLHPPAHLHQVLQDVLARQLIGLDVHSAHRDQQIPKTFQTIKAVSHLPSHTFSYLFTTGLIRASDDFTTSFLQFSLFSIALWDTVNYRPVHSLMLPSHLFFCMPCLHERNKCCLPHTKKNIGTNSINPLTNNNNNKIHFQNHHLSADL